MLREAEKVKVDGQEEEGGGPAIAGSPAPRTSPAALPRGRLINVRLCDAGAGGGLTGRAVATRAGSGPYLAQSESCPRLLAPGYPALLGDRWEGELARAVSGVGDCYYRVASAREHQMPVSGSLGPSGADERRGGRVSSVRPCRHLRRR